VTKLQAGRP